MRLILSIILLALSCAAAQAQQLRALSLQPTSDLPNGKLSRQDFNGVPAAIVKVLLPVQGVRFDGNLIGEPMFDVNQYYVWLEGYREGVSPGTREFDIQCPGVETLRVTFADISDITLLSPGAIYELRLDVPDKLRFARSSGPADLGGDYLVLTVTPKENVMVKVDGTPKVTRGGQLNEFLAYGDHTYSIEAPGYISETGSVTIQRGGGKVRRNVALHSAMCTLTVTAETPGTVISVNEEKKGSGQWSAQMVPGNYRIEATLEGYKPYSTALVMGEGESKTVKIPALEHIYAALQVDYYPSGSQVKIDGKVVGETPLALSNLTATKHSLEITADGYQPYQQQITLTEAKPLRIAGELKAKPKHTIEEAGRYYGLGQYDKAVAIYRALAEQGDAAAQLELASCYYSGRGVVQSNAEAVKWWKKSAEQGDYRAQFDLAHCYLNGHGVTQSRVEAVKWFRKSAEQGYAIAQFWLGGCYAQGWGVAQSWDEAVKWFRKSAEQGDSFAQSNLADCYWNGNGVAQNKDEAVRWWRLAAKQGNGYAKDKLKENGYSE